MCEPGSVAALIRVFLRLSKTSFSILYLATVISFSLSVLGTSLGARFARAVLAGAAAAQLSSAIQHTLCTIVSASPHA